MSKSVADRFLSSKTPSKYFFKKYNLIQSSAGRPAEIPQSTFNRLPSCHPYDRLRIPIHAVDVSSRRSRSRSDSEKIAVNGDSCFFLHDVDSPFALFGETAAVGSLMRDKATLAWKTLGKDLNLSVQALTFQTSSSSQDIGYRSSCPSGSDGQRSLYCPGAPKSRSTEA